MKFAMPEISLYKANEDNTRAAKVLQEGQICVNDTKAFHEKMKELANKLINKEIVNLKLAKLHPQLHLPHSASTSRRQATVSTSPSVVIHCVDEPRASRSQAVRKVKEGETTRPAYAKLSLFDDDAHKRIARPRVSNRRHRPDSIDKMNQTEFDMLMQQFGISQFITPLAVPRLLAEPHSRSLGARFIELLFDNDVAVNSCRIHPTHHAPLPRPQVMRDNAAVHFNQVLW